MKFTWILPKESNDDKTPRSFRGENTDARLAIVPVDLAIVQDFAFWRENRKE